MKRWNHHYLASSPVLQSLPWVLLRGLLEELLPQWGWKAYSARPVLPPEPQLVGLPAEELWHLHLSARALIVQLEIALQVPYCRHPHLMVLILYVHL